MEVLIQKSRVPRRVGVFLAWPLPSGRDHILRLEVPQLLSGMEEMGSGRGCWKLTQEPSQAY